MRLNINLATQPYEDAGRFTRIWSVILGALLILAIVFTLLVFKRGQAYRHVARAIAVERGVLEDLDRKQAEDVAILNLPENQDVRQRSEFLNQLIRRKEVSWTNIFINLEKMMPPHLRVLSVSPSIKNEQIIVSLQLGGDSRERAAELVRRMENSKTFRNAQVVNEADSGERAGEQDAMRFSVIAEYIPDINDASPRSEISARGGK